VAQLTSTAALLDRDGPLFRQYPGIIPGPRGRAGGPGPCCLLLFCPQPVCPVGPADSGDSITGRQWWPGETDL